MVFQYKYFPNQTFFPRWTIALNIYTITNLLFLTTHIPHITNTSISIPLETWIRAPAYIFWRTDPFLCHTSLTLCAVLRPAPLASYYFPFLSFPLLSPCIGLSLGSIRSTEYCLGRLEELSCMLSCRSLSWSGLNLRKKQEIIVALDWFSRKTGEKTGDKKKTGEKQEAGKIKSKKTGDSC